MYYNTCSRISNARALRWCSRAGINKNHQYHSLGLQTSFIYWRDGLSGCIECQLYQPIIEKLTLGEGHITTALLQYLFHWRKRIPNLNHHWLDSSSLQVHLLTQIVLRQKNYEWPNSPSFAFSPFGHLLQVYLLAHSCRNIKQIKWYIMYSFCVAIVIHRVLVNFCIGCLYVYTR